MSSSILRQQKPSYLSVSFTWPESGIGPETPATSLLRERDNHIRNPLVEPDDGT